MTGWDLALLAHFNANTDGRAGEHAHACPECYRKVVCGYTGCTIEHDLFEEGEMPLGAHATCADCERAEHLEGCDGDGI